MKNASHAISTLNPVRRVAAFFAFLGFLTFSACAEKKDSRQELMNEQAAVFSEMTIILNQFADGGDSAASAEKLTALAEKHKGLKRSLSAFDNTKEEDIAVIRDHQVYADALTAFFEAHNKLAASGKMTPAIEKALASLHDAAPITGEGSSQ